MNKILALLFIFALVSAKNLRAGDAADVNVDVDNVNNVIQDIETNIGANQSGFVVLHNVNFGVIVQQIGDFSLQALSIAKAFAPTYQDSNDVDNSIHNISNVIQSIKTNIGFNQSGVVVLSKSNFGVIVQQIGEFQQQIQNQLRQAKQQIKLQEGDNADVDVNVDGVNNVIQDIETNIGVNQSGFVVGQQVNFGVIVQQIGKFTADVAQKIQDAANPANNYTDNVDDVNVDVSDISNVIQQIKTNMGLNQSGIVILDDVNFGVITQQIGEFDAQIGEQKQKLQSGDVADVDVEVSDVNNLIQNIETAMGLNQSAIVVLNNVNFGVIVQQIGEFALDLEQLRAEAEELKRKNIDLLSKYIKKQTQQ